MSALQTSPLSLPEEVTPLRDSQRAGHPDIAFIGKAGAGKSTATDWAADIAGYRPLSFATPLKEIALNLWNDLGAERDKLQKLGMAVREIDPDAWVNLLLRRLPYSKDSVAIDDCRFPNEYWALKGAGFVMVRVETPATDRLFRLKSSGKDTTPEQLEHISETSLDDLPADHTVQNTGDRLRFYEDLTKLLGKLVAR